MLQVTTLLLLSAALAFAQYIPAGSGGGGSSGSGISYCAPASASGTTYTCTPSPAVSSYAAGTTLAFVPDVNGTGGATTVNVNALGAKSIKLADGSTNPLASTLVASTAYTLTYDGTVFRITPSPSGAAIYYKGDCQGGSPSFALSTPSSNAPTFTCVASGTTLSSVAQWANNTSNVTAQNQFIVPANFVTGGSVTARIKYRSADSTHATPVTISYYSLADGTAIDNPTFTALSPTSLTANASSQQTTTLITFAMTGAAKNTLYWKILADTTSLTGGATWDLISITFEF